MTGIVKVYGYITGQAEKWGEVSKALVEAQVEMLGDQDEILVQIHSPGGEVIEAFAIHDYLRGLDKTIITDIVGECASAATIIALAGDTRRMSSNSEWLVHNPRGKTEGDVDEMERYVNEGLKNKERIAEFYASKTNLTKEQALAMMKSETILSPTQAIEAGFITEETLVMTVDKDQRMNTAEAKEELGRFQKFLNSILGDRKEKFKAIVLQTSEEIEVDFYEREEGDPEVGDKARVDGSPATGTHQFPQLEAEITFEDGVVTTITPFEEEPDEEMEAMKQENAQLQEQLTTAQAEVTALKAERDTLKMENAKATESLKEVDEKFTALREKFTSDFKLDDKEDKEPGADKSGKKESRKLFKD